MRSLILAALTAASPATAQPGPVLHLCPPSVVNTCFVGYVTAAEKMVVLLSTAANDPLINREVSVHVGSPAGPDALAAEGDLRKEVGRIVMLDAIGTDKISDARIAYVADPLLTALYLALAAPTHSN